MCSSDASVPSAAEAEALLRPKLPGVSDVAVTASNSSHTASIQQIMLYFVVPGNSSASDVVIYSGTVLLGEAGLTPVAPPTFNRTSGKLKPFVLECTSLLSQCFALFCVPLY